MSETNAPRSITESQIVGFATNSVIPAAEQVATLTADLAEARERADLAERNREASLALRDESDVELMEAQRLIREFAEATEQMRDRRNDEFARVCAREMESARASLLAYAAKHAKGTP